MWSHRPWGRMHVTHESGRSSAILTPSQLIFFCIVSLEADHRAGENFAASEENMVARNPVNLPFFQVGVDVLWKHFCIVKGIPTDWADLFK